MPSAPNKAESALGDVQGFIDQLTEPTQRQMAQRDLGEIATILKDNGSCKAWPPPPKE